MSRRVSLPSYSVLARMCCGAMLEIISLRTVLEKTMWFPLAFVANVIGDDLLHLPEKMLKDVVKESEFTQ